VRAKCCQLRKFAMAEGSSAVVDDAASTMRSTMGSTMAATTASATGGADDMPADPKQRSQVMMLVKSDRKRAEADAQLLANRLQHLRMEEAKARGRIVATQNRVDEIRYLKKRNEDHAARRQAQRTLHRQAVANEQTTMTQDRKGRARKIYEARANLISSKKKEIEQHKKAQKQRDLKLAEDRRAEMARNRKRKDDIRAMQEARRKKREAEAKAREERQREQCRARMREEEEKKVAAEAAIAAMEKMEAELIERLRKTQADQAAAYDDLRNCLQPG